VETVRERPTVGIQLQVSVHETEKDPFRVTYPGDRNAAAEPKIRSPQPSAVTAPPDFFDKISLLSRCHLRAGPANDRHRRRARIIILRA